MNMKKMTAVAFVDAINSQDMEGLQALFAAPCLLNGEHPLFDYRIQVERIVTDNDLVILIGEARTETGRIPATWTAQICGCRVVDWHAYFSDEMSLEN